jgi:hypothetical protein
MREEEEPEEDDRESCVETYDSRKRSALMERKPLKHD